MGDCFVPRSDISFGLLEKTFLDSYTERFTPDEAWEAAQKIYANHPEYLAAVKEALGR
jgi:hypothetical protein